MTTSRDIIDKLLRGERAERMGVFEYFWPDAKEKWVAEEGYPTDDEGKPASQFDVFDLDMVECGGWFDAMPLRGVEEIVEETEEWAIKRNGAGGLLKRWKHKSGTPEHIDFRMTTREIWDRDYRPHLLKLDRERLKIDYGRKELEKRKAEGRWTLFGNMFMWEFMRCSMGDVCMYESLLLDPDWILDYGRVYTDFFKAHYELFFTEAGKPDGIWMYEDLGYRNGLLCSPSVLEELIFPYFKEMVDFFHGHDLPVVLHTCGGIEEALPLIVQAGFDALHPMEVKAGCDVVRFANKYKDKLAFVGGMDTRIFEKGDREQIRSEIVRITDAMRDMGARYVFGSDHSISPNTRLADYRYALEVYKDNMAY